MRLQAAVILLLVSSGSAHAKEPPTKVILTEGGNAQTFSGTSIEGAATRFSIEAPDARSMTLTLSANNEDCGAEMRTTTQHGFLPDFRSFPTKRSVDMKHGEVFTLSFFQTRSAWINKTACAFTLVVE